VTSAREFAEGIFKRSSREVHDWNIAHVKCMIKAIEELTEDQSIKNRLNALAWVHDIGKTKSDKNHASISVEILEKEFELDEIDRDCILNHGSSSQPETKEGKIFHYADGISLFYPETINLRFGDITKEEVKSRIKFIFQKYKLAYSDNDKAVELLTKKVKKLFGAFISI